MLRLGFQAYVGVWRCFNMFSSFSSLLGLCSGWWFDSSRPSMSDIWRWRRGGPLFPWCFCSVSTMCCCADKGGLQCTSEPKKRKGILRLKPGFSPRFFASRAMFYLVPWTAQEEALPKSQQHNTKISSYPPCKINQESFTHIVISKEIWKIKALFWLAVVFLTSDPWPLMTALKICHFSQFTSARLALLRIASHCCRSKEEDEQQSESGSKEAALFGWGKRHGRVICVQSARGEGGGWKDRNQKGYVSFGHAYV